MHSEEDLADIIAHEKVHIRDFHWVDLLIAELLTVVFWFNPTCARINSLKKTSFFIVLIINDIRNLVKIFSYSLICKALIIND